jgi:hypothetical protein
LLYLYESARLSARLPACLPKPNDI